MIGSVCGPIGSSIVADRPGCPPGRYPTIRPSLIPMSALTTPMVGSTTTRRRSRRPARIGPAAARPGPSAPDVLGVAPQRLVARMPGASSLDPQPQVGVAEPDPVVGGGPVASVVGVARRRVTVRPRPDPIRPPNRTSSTPAARPAPSARSRPPARSSRNPVAATRSNAAASSPARTGSGTTPARPGAIGSRR